MIEYTDGHFGTIAPAKDILELLHTKFINFEEVKAVHFGNVDELKLIRDEKCNYQSIRNDVEELKRELESLKPKGPIKVYQLEDIPKENK